MHEFVIEFRLLKVNTLFYVKYSDAVWSLGQMLHPLLHRHMMFAVLVVPVPFPST